MAMGGMEAVGLQPTYEPPMSSGMTQETPLSGMLIQRPPQRWVMFFHVIFKVLALLIYLMASYLLSNSYVLTFVLVTVLSAVDLWTVKNVCGRLLVGLRWWNFIDEEGNSHWRFESYEEQRYIHPTDSNFFWLVLFLAPAAWIIIALGAVITLHFMWLLLVLVAMGCSLINVVGYVKCKNNAKKKLAALGGTILSRGMEMGANMWSAASAAQRSSSQ